MAEQRLDLVPEVPLAWARQDIEQRLAFRGARHTRVNNWLSGLIAVVLTVIFYASLLPLRGTEIHDSFTTSFVTYAIVFFSAWGLTILLIKSRKIAYQRRALAHAIVPRDRDFVLSSATVDDVYRHIYAVVDDPKHFVLFNRIAIALSNLRNLGRVTDVDDILRSQASHDESAMETSYSLLRGLVWAIPVLGFIGTVLGLSVAIGNFGGVLQTADDISQIKGALQNVTGGLATAFQTTLQALVAALFLQLLLTFVKKSEEEFLDECSEYCIKYVVNRLRIMPYENAIDTHAD